MTSVADWSRGQTLPPPWKKGEASVRFRNPWLEVIEQPAVAPTGRKVVYGEVRYANLAVGVLPIHADGTVILIGQQRFPLENFSWEMPEGGAPHGEDPLEGCQRELAEEAGLKAGVWREALRLELSNSVTDEQGVTWLAWDLEPVAGEADDTEMLVQARVPFRDLIAAIESGEVRDALTVATAMRAHHMAVTGQLPEALANAMLGR